MSFEMLAIIFQAMVSLVMLIFILCAAVGLCALAVLGMVRFIAFVEARCPTAKDAPKRKLI